MNPGVTEEAGKAAQSTIDALKSTPVVLALVIFNVLFMGLAAWSGHESGQRYERIITAAFRYCPGVLYEQQEKKGGLPMDETTGQSARYKLQSAEPLEPKEKELLHTAIDNAFVDQVEHLFIAWMKDSTGQPDRAAVGVKRALAAYRQSHKAIERVP